MTAFNNDFDDELYKLANEEFQISYQNFMDSKNNALCPVCGRTKKMLQDDLYGVISFWVPQCHCDIRNYVLKKHGLKFL